MNPLVLAACCAVLMEPATALMHRAVMHGRVGWPWHRSHHRPRTSTFDANDLFPVVFALATIVTMALGAIPVGAGITAYGVAYAVVHDVCIHGRLTDGRPVLPGRWLRWVAASHAVHHRTGRAPYGFLVPIVPAKQRSATPSLRGVDTRARFEKTS